MSSAPIGVLLGEGKEAQAYAYGEHVLKLYRRPGQRSIAFAEAAVLAIVADHPLPVPAIHEAGRYGERWGLVMDRAGGDSLGSRFMTDAAEAPAVLAAMVRLHVAMHACAEPRLPPLKRRLGDRIGRAPGIDALREGLLATLAALPEGDRICHGDFHPFNLMGNPDAAIIVDWADATSGPPAADVCRSWLILAAHVPDAAQAYLAAYTAAATLTAESILAWLPVLAAARLCENIPEEEALLRRFAAGERP